jgi:hypothetical protein
MADAYPPPHAFSPYRLHCQGLMPYYYQILHPGRSVELHWCTLNNMCSPSRDKGVVNGKPHGTCYTGEIDCEDCRERSVEEVISTHFTVCQKPWLCLGHSAEILEQKLCRQFTHEWFKTRSELEISWGRSGWGEGKVDRDHFFGYCTKHGKTGYTLIEQPYGSSENQISRII